MNILERWLSCLNKSLSQKYWGLLLRPLTSWSDALIKISGSNACKRIINRRRKHSLACSAEVFEERVLLSAPTFDLSSYSFTVAESGNGMEVTAGTTTASDPDGDMLSFSVTSGDPSNQFSFDMDGNLTAWGGLDYETTNSYNLTVEVSDGSGTDTATVFVTVTDIAEAPVFDFSVYSFSVAESGNGMEVTVGTPTASDPQGDMLSYSIIGGDPNGEFSFDMDGNLSAPSGLDYESTNSYNLTLEVSDGSETDTATVLVTVTDIAEAPVFDFSVYSFSVAESGNGMEVTVGTPNASDPQGDMLSYSINGGDPNGEFSFDMDGNLSAPGGLDYESTNSYNLTLEVTDGSETDTATVLVTVTDIAEAPVFDFSVYSFSVAESSNGMEITLGTISASDPQGDMLSYSVIGGDPNGHFSFDMNGNLIAPGGLDFETTNSYLLTVEVSDGLETDIANVVVAVTDIAEAPVFDSNSYSYTVAENSDGTEIIIGTPTATDPQGDMLTYTIISGNSNGQLAFDMDGNLVAPSGLDFETDSSYSLVIEVSDGFETDTATVLITVTNVPEPPLVTSFYYQLVNAATNEWKFTGTVIDPDGTGGQTVVFGGILTGHTATVGTSALFSLTVIMDPNDIGPISVKAIDSTGLESNLFEDYFIQ